MMHMRSFLLGFGVAGHMFCIGSLLPKRQLEGLRPQIRAWVPKSVTWQMLLLRVAVGLPDPNTNTRLPRCTDSPARPGIFSSTLGH